MRSKIACLASQSHRLLYDQGSRPWVSTWDLLLFSRKKHSCSSSSVILPKTWSIGLLSVTCQVAISPVPILCIAAVQAFCRRIKNAETTTLQQTCVPDTYIYILLSAAKCVSLTIHWELTLLGALSDSWRFSFLPLANHCDPTWDPKSTWLK